MHYRSTRDKTGNCRAGFVTTEGLSNPTVLDFYLQSHAAVKGSKCGNITRRRLLDVASLMRRTRLLLASRSSHYIVLEDENYNKNVTEYVFITFPACSMTEYITLMMI